MFKWLRELFVGPTPKSAAESEPVLPPLPAPEPPPQVPEPEPLVKNTKPKRSTSNKKPAAATKPVTRGRPRKNG